MTSPVPAERTSGPIMSVPAFPAGPPPKFVDHRYERTWNLDRQRDRVWEWLCDPATFVDGQVPPFRVEFLTSAGQDGFSEGVYNAHVGPLMNFSGVLGTIEPGRYRDLQYFYGSYALSHGLFRPTRLQFWLDETPEGGTELTLRLDAYVRSWAARAWTGLMNAFWRNFGFWARRSIKP